MSYSQIFASQDSGEIVVPPRPSDDASVEEWAHYSYWWYQKNFHSYYSGFTEVQWINYLKGKKKEAKERRKNHAVQSHKIKSTQNEISKL